METTLNLALRFICENPINKYSGKYDDLEDNGIGDAGKSDEIITPRPDAEITMISSRLADGSRITIYWDMSYGPVLVIDNRDNKDIKRLSGVPLTSFLQAGLAQLGITHVRFLRHQLEFAKDKEGQPKLIIIQTITQCKESTPECKTWKTLIYNLSGQLLFEIEGEQDVRNIPGWMNWLLTPDGRWIILWQSDCFQPLFYRISDLEDRLIKKKGYHLRVDRLDWIPKISPYTISNITYLPRLPSSPSNMVNEYDEYKPITHDEYLKYLRCVGELDADETLDEDGYLLVNVNDLAGSNNYNGAIASNSSDGHLGTEISHGHKSTNIPITCEGPFMIDLHKRRLIPISSKSLLRL